MKTSELFVIYFPYINTIGTEVFTEKETAEKALKEETISFDQMLKANAWGYDFNN